jgi:ketosteroid isomerase-like protein
VTDQGSGSRAGHERPRDPDDLGWLFLQRANAGDVQPAIRLGDLALTSTRFDIIATTAGGRTTTTRTATTEIARRQPDGTWLWAVDQPNVLAP